ncbi:WYL domain-containing protein [Candidatus Microgenomates bacterium]|nr:WYL domain-containing protein [Candidatus Microgenomates bacterium]
MSDFGRKRNSEVEEAFEKNKRLEIEYVSTAAQAGEDFRKIRQIDIISINKPYIEAYCHLRQDKRNFRIDRILKVKILEVL